MNCCLCIGVDIFHLLARVNAAWAELSKQAKEVGRRSEFKIPKCPFIAVMDDVAVYK